MNSSVKAAAAALILTYAVDICHSSPNDSTMITFDLIIRSMNDNLVTDSTENESALRHTLDYLERLFDTVPDHEHPQIIGGDQTTLLPPASIPAGDVPINVAEFTMPASGIISSHFGPRKNSGRLHRGVDIAINHGDTVRAAFPGIVRLTSHDRHGYGYYIILSHPNGLQTLYAHLDRFLVIPNQKIAAGEPIAIGGSSGNSTAAHLHFEIRFRAIAIDPETVVDFRSRRPISATFIFNKEAIDPPLH